MHGSNSFWNTRLYNFFILLFFGQYLLVLLVCTNHLLELVINSHFVNLDLHFAQGTITLFFDPLQNISSFECVTALADYEGVSHDAIGNRTCHVLLNEVIVLYVWFDGHDGGVNMVPLLIIITSISIAIACIALNLYVFVFFEEWLESFG